MKHIGIVACSVEGAALCYQQIGRYGHRLIGSNDHPRVTIDSIPLAAWMPAFDADDRAELAEIMLDSVHVVARAGAELAICPDNSAHLAWEEVQAATPIPWLHIAVAVGEAARALGAGRVGLLGTRFTMAGPVYPTALARLGIETIAPEGDDAKRVDQIIFTELINGVVTDESRRTYVEVIERLRDRGCDAVALACTEIPLLIGPDDSPLPTLDSTGLLAEAAVRAAMT